MIIVKEKERQKCRSFHLHDAIHIHGDIRSISLWELLTTYEECVEGICAICAMFEEVLLRLSEFLPTFIFSESVASACDASHLDSQDEVVIVLSVEERHEPLLPGKRLIDEQILLIMPHRIPQVDVYD